MEGAINTRIGHFRKEFLVVDFVESLREIKQDRVNLFAVVQTGAEVSDSCDKLSLATVVLPEAMLERVKEPMLFEVIHNVAVDNVFKKLGGY